VSARTKNERTGNGEAVHRLVRKEMSEKGDSEAVKPNF